MEKITQLLLFISAFSTLLCTSSHAQKIQLEKNYGGKHSDYLMDVIATPDYGFILAGTSSSNKGFNKREDSRGINVFFLEFQIQNDVKVIRKI